MSTSGDRAQSAVVDVAVAVVAAGDHPIPGCVFGQGDLFSVLGQRPGAFEAFARGLVELLAGLVVAGDHHRAGGSVLALGMVPLIDQRADCGGLAVVDGDLVLLVGEVSIGVSVVQGFKRPALGGIVLADHLAQSGARLGASERGEPAPGLHRAELARVADSDHFDSVSLGASQKLRAQAGRCHPCLVDHQDRASREPAGSAQFASQRVHRSRRDPGGIAQLTGCAAGRGRTDHAPARVLIARSERCDHRRLAGPGQRRHGVDPVAAFGDRAHRRGLVVVQRRLMADQDPVDPADRYKPDALRSATLRAVEDRALAGQQPRCRKPGLGAMPRRERPDACMGEVPVGCVLQSRERGPIAKRARDVRQRMPTNKRVVPRGQTFSARQALGEHIQIWLDWGGAPAADERVEVGLPEPVLGRPCASQVTPARHLNAVVLRAPGRKRDPLHPLP